MTLAVLFGSRSWDDLETIEEVIDRMLLAGDGSLRVVTGANGVTSDGSQPEASADALADWAAARRGFRPVRVPASWYVHDRDGASGVKCSHAPRIDRSGRDYCPAAGNRRNLEVIVSHVLPAIETEELVFVAGFQRTDGRSPGTEDMRGRLRPLVKSGKAVGIFRTAAAPAPSERRRARRAPDRTGEPFDAFPAPPWPERREA